MNPSLRSLLLLAVTATPAVAQQPRLGTIDFPVTGLPAAQPAFVRGVLFLHSFEYASALRAFREAQAVDPAFVMAFWGEAMTWTHPVWNQQDLDSARATLARFGPTRAARLARAATPRERAYFAAVEDLYGDGSKQRRDTLFSRAMLRMVDDYPADLEAKAFAALGLLGLNQGVRDYGSYMRAAVLAQQVYRANPDHPGGAHYIIHAFDDPIHAPLGLEAARAYSHIAPDAAHAQHMTTHIFLALGMWDDVVSQNVIATDEATHHGQWTPGHYTEWLHYAELQQGRYRDAAQLFARVLGGVRTAGHRSYLARMRAQHVVATEDWASALWQTPIDLNGQPAAEAEEVFTRGLAAVRRGAGREAAAQRAELARLAEAAHILDATDSLAYQKVAVMDLELRALLRRMDGATDAALGLLGEATTLEDRLPRDFGPPEIVKPSHELFGEVLMELNRPADAQREFSRALDLAPGRARSLIGLVRAAAAAGDRAVAESAFRLLQSNWHDADAGLPDLGTLRPLLATR